MRGAALSRRDLFQVLAAGASAAGLSAGVEPSLTFSSIEKVEFSVSDLERSVKFYASIFGNELYKNKRAEKHYLKIGPGYLGIDHADTPRINNHSLSIRSLEMPALHAFLERQGVAYKDYPSGRDLYFTDPDGTRTQLSSENSWNSLIANTAAPESPPVQGDPVFHATGLDHVLLNVSDSEKSAAFYEKILGPVSQRNNNRIWFQVGSSRVGLLKTPDGGKPGVNHYCVRAERFDYDAALKKLEQAGAKIEAPEVSGAPEFRDPDGFLVQVMGPR